MKSKVNILIAAGFILLVLFGIYSYKKYTRNIIDEMIARNNLINILIAGRNVYNDNTFNFYAIVSINPGNNNIGITFIPPDYSVKMNDDGTKIKKISELDFYYFDRIQYSLKKDIQLNVPFYVKLYSPDVLRIVDMIEGMNLFLLNNFEGLKANFGVNYFDGRKVVKYINGVKDNSIYLKYDRIFDILMTLYHDRENLKKYADLDFINDVIKNIKTNLMPQEILSLTQIILKNGNFMATLLPGGFYNGYYQVDEISYRTYQQDFLTNLVTGTEGETNVKITILNGTEVPGLARKYRNDLIRDGLNVIEFGTFDRTDINSSILICRSCDYKSANKVADMTGINQIYFVTDTTQLSNILIVIGEDRAGDKKKK